MRRPGQASPGDGDCRLRSVGTGGAGCLKIGRKSDPGMCYGSAMRKS